MGFSGQLTQFPESEVVGCMQSLLRRSLVSVSRTLWRNSVREMRVRIVPILEDNYAYLVIDDTTKARVLALVALFPCLMRYRLSHTRTLTGSAHHRKRRRLIRRWRRPCCKRCKRKACVSLTCSPRTTIGTRTSPHSAELARLPTLIRDWDSIGLVRCQRSLGRQQADCGGGARGGRGR